MRRNGDVMTTIRLAYHVPKAMVEWLVDEAGWSEEEAMRAIRRDVDRLGTGWHTFYFDPQDGNVTVDHVDQRQEHERCGDTTYEGPPIAPGATR